MGVWIKRIPGVVAVYHVAYHFLNEFLWLWPGRNVMEIEGSKMYLNPRAKSCSLKTAFRNYIRSCGREELTTQLFKQAIKDGYTVIDIGANIGYFSLLAAKLVGNRGKVYAFEPEPRNYEAMLKNIGLNGYDNTVAVQKAVSNTAGMVKLYLANTDVGAHTLRELHNHPAFKKKQHGEFIEVESVTLDEFFKDKEHRIDVIKMDCEGSEAAVISGADRLLRENKGLKMFIEFYPAAIREMGYSPEELVSKLLKEYGFSITALDELKLQTPTNKSYKISSVEELMSLYRLYRDEDKVINLFLERAEGGN